MAPRAGTHRADRHQTWPANRHVPRQPDRRGVSAACAAVPDRHFGEERGLHRIRQRERDATCRKLRRQCWLDRPRRHYKFYAEGVTPMIGRLYEAINAERVAVADKLGAKVPDLATWFELTYGVREK